MSLLLVIMTAIYSVWLGLERTYAFTEEDMQAQHEGRAAMSEMVEYMRTARRPDNVADPTFDTPIVAAGPHSITMWTDTTRDGTHSLELVRFRVEPDPTENPTATTFELYRDEGDAGTYSSVRLVSYHVANDASNPLFTYLDGRGNEVDDPATELWRVRQIAINLRIDVDPSRSPIVNQLSTIVTPRNLR